MASLGLEAYADRFDENCIDAEVLPDLTSEDLKEMGIRAVGHRRKLLTAIATLQNEASHQTPPDPAPPKSPQPPQPEGERRQVAVLFADICGFTQLSTMIDSEELHALLAACFDRVDGIIRAYGGTVDKHIGDSAMAIFGAPISHGNDAERAVRAALAIRDAMPELSETLGRRLDCHIGVTSGQVVASGIGADTHYTVVGDPVNLAAERQFACHRSLVLDFGVGRGQDPVRTLVRSLLEISDETQADGRAAAAEPALADGVVAEDNALHLRDLLDLPRSAADQVLYDAMNNLTRNAGKRATVSALACRLSRQQPRLIVVEDLHWADEILLEQIAQLVRTQEIAEAEGVSDVLMRLHHLRGNLLFPKGDIAGCAAGHRQSLVYAREIGSAEAEARGLGGVGASVIGSARRVGHDRAELNAQAACVFAACEQGDWPGADLHAERVTGLANRIGSFRFNDEVLAFRALRPSD